MAFVQVPCPDCHSTDVVQYGKQANGTQRYRCNNRDCSRTIFLIQYQDKGRLPAVKQQIVDMTRNGSGVRDIVRVLRVSSATVIDVLKKKEPAVKQVNEKLLHTLDPPQVDVILRQVDAAEMDEMWSFVGSKSQQRWLWHAIDHHTGQILAYVWHTRGCNILKTERIISAVWHYTLLYGWLGGLSPSSRTKHTYSGETADAKDRTQTHDFPDSYQTLDQEDHLFFALYSYA